MADSVNPFYFFPLEKRHLEKYLEAGTLKPVIQGVYRTLLLAVRADYSPSGEAQTPFAKQLERLKGKEIEVDNLSDQINSGLNNAYSAIDGATPDQLATWVASYGTGGSLGGISEADLNEILTGVEARVLELQTEKSGLEEQVTRLTHALGQALQGKGPKIDSRVLQQVNGANSSVLDEQVRHLTGQLEMARSLEESLRQTIDTLRGDGTRYQKRERRLQTDLTHLTIERNGLREDVTRLEGNLRTVGRRVAALTQQVHEQSAQVQAYQQAATGTRPIFKDARQLETYVTSAQVALREKRYSDSRGLFILALESDPRNVQALNGVVQTFQAQKVSGVEKLNQPLTFSNLGNKEVLTTLGTLAKNVHDYHTAAFFFDRVTVLDGADVAAHYHLGTIAHQVGDLDAARGRLETVLRISPKHSSGHYALALVYSDLRDTARARAHAVEAVQLRTNFKEQDLAAARKHRDAGRTSPAFISYERAILFNSNNVSILTAVADELNTLGVSYKERKNYDVAKQAFTLASVANPTSPHPTYHLGTLAMQDKKWEEAQRYFTQTLAHAKDHRYAHYQLGLVYQHLRLLDDARSHLTRAQELGHQSAASALSNLK